MKHNSAGNIKQRLEKDIQNVLSQQFPKEHVEWQVTYPEAQFGDYACNAAMILAKQLGENPTIIAKKIIKAFPKSDLFERIEIAGPGFINFLLSEKSLSEGIFDILIQQKNYGAKQIEGRRPVIVEYSQPNIAKPLGVHHLLSTIIGQSLYNLYKVLGYETISINHIGDWGTQFGKLIVAYKKWGDRKKIQKNPIQELLALYVRFHEEENPSLEEEARKTFKALEDGDKEIRELWQWCVFVSMEDIQKTYDMLGGIHFDYTQGESFYSDKMKTLLEEGKKKKIFQQGEEGAWIVEFANGKLPPYIVQKKDEATLYATRDIATIRYRTETWHPEKILYVVDVAQKLYFEQLFETAKMFGGNMTESELVHVIFGRMRFKNKQMSTRKGNIIVLNEVIEEAIKRAIIVVKEKNPDITEQEMHDIARKIGIGAVKYSIVSQHRITDIVFDWDRVLALDGNSAPYLQYTFARYTSILRKAQVGNTSSRELPVFGSSEQRFSEALLRFSSAYEKLLARKLLKYPEILLHAAELYKPNLLCNYLYDLTQISNTFYTHCPVLQAENSDLQEMRLKLIEATTIVLGNGLEILGIETPERM